MSYESIIEFEKDQPVELAKTLIDTAVMPTLIAIYKDDPASLELAMRGVMGTMLGAYGGIFGKAMAMRWLRRMDELVPEIAAIPNSMQNKTTH